MHQQLTAAELIDRCSRGRDAGSWEEFHRRFRARLRGGVRRAFRCAGRLPDPDALEEMEQEIYCRLLATDRRALRLCRGRRESEIGGYLTRLAERVTLDHLRRRGAACRNPEREAPLAELAAPPCLSARAERRLLARERLARFVRACRSACRGPMAERDLAILRWALIEGMSSREIAERLGGRLTPSGVDSQLCRLRQRLRRSGCTLPRRRPCRAPTGRS